MKQKYCLDNQKYCRNCHKITDIRITKSGQTYLAVVGTTRPHYQVCKKKSKRLSKKDRIMAQIEKERLERGQEKW